MKVVISQPMFFPWMGIFEQILQSDIFVHYDDVQLPQGRSFVNRVQIKTKDGIKWLTVPLDRNKSKININQAEISYINNWELKHLKFLKHNYVGSDFLNEIIKIISYVYGKKHKSISELNIDAVEKISEYFGINTIFLKSSNLNIQGKSSERLLNITQKLGGSIYLSGWGALNYLDFSIFEKNNIEVQIMDYKKRKYTQNYGDFTPFVSILDMIANVGKEGKSNLVSKGIYYKEFIQNKKNDANRTI